MYSELTATAQSLYAELLEQCLVSSYSRNGISALKVMVKGGAHWYLELTVGNTRRRQYIGPDTPENRDWVARFKQAKSASKDERQQRQRLVSMLAAAGYKALAGREFRVFESLSQAGVFLVGGVVVGSHAFSLIGNTLGVAWDDQLVRTQDIDIANDYRIHVGLSKHDTDIEKALQQADASFLPVPALNRKSPSTTFMVGGAELRVDMLTPMIGKTSAEPIALQSIKAMAQPVRFLDFLLQDTQPAVVIAGSGVLVNIPNPTRYALHKLVVAQRRQAGFQAKANKDLKQAKVLLDWLEQNRPGDIGIAMDAVADMPEKFNQQLHQGLKSIDHA